MSYLTTWALFLRIFFSRPTNDYRVAGQHYCRWAATRFRHEFVVIGSNWTDSGRALTVIKSTRNIHLWKRTSVLFIDGNHMKWRPIQTISTLLPHEMKLIIQYYALLKPYFEIAMNNWNNCLLSGNLSEIDAGGTDSHTTATIRNQRE